MGDEAHIESQGAWSRVRVHALGVLQEGRPKAPSDAFTYLVLEYVGFTCLIAAVLSSFLAIPQVVGVSVHPQLLRLLLAAVLAVSFFAIHQLSAVLQRGRLLVLKGCAAAGGGAHCLSFLRLRRP